MILKCETKGQVLVVLPTISKFSSCKSSGTSGTVVFIVKQYGDLLTRHLSDFGGGFKIDSFFSKRHTETMYFIFSKKEKWACSKSTLHTKIFLFLTHHLESGVQELLTPVLKIHQLILVLMLHPQFLLSMVQKNNSLELQTVVLSQYLSRKN